MLHGYRGSLNDTLAFLEADRDGVVTHGDRCPAFAAELRDEGFEAQAPELGESWTSS